MPDSEKNSLKERSKNPLLIVYIAILILVISNTIILVIWFSHLSLAQGKFFNTIGENQINLTQYETYIQEYNSYLEEIEGRKFVIVKQKDVNNILDLLIYLKKDFESAKDKITAENSILIDKVNLYLSIGIVLLTLMGIFIPVLVQTFSNENLKTKQNELKERQDDLLNEIGLKNDKIDGMEDRIEFVADKIEIDLGKLETIEKKVKDIESDSYLIFPIRLIYLLDKVLDKDTIKQHITNPNNYNKIITISFTTIYDEFEKCKNKEIYPCNDSFFKDGIINFIKNYNMVLLSIYDRKLIEKYEELITELKSFIKITSYNKESYDPLLIKLKSLIDDNSTITA